jgi:hypothetical protein
MRKLLLVCLLLFPFAIHAQPGTTQYPTSLDTSTTLPVSADSKLTFLTASATNSVTTFTVNSTTGFPSSGVLLMPSGELVAYAGSTSTTFTGLTRGFSGTTAQAYSANQVVKLSLSSAYVNGPRGAAVALETKIGPGSSDASAASTGHCLVKQSGGTTQWAACGSGEANTASNVNVGGVGVFKQKSGVDLQLKGVNAGSSKVTVTDDPANNEIDVDVAEANLTLSNMGGTLGVAHGGTNKTSWTAGSIPYLTSTFAEDNSNFFWDGTNHRLGLGTNSPNAMLDVRGDGAFTKSGGATFSTSDSSRSPLVPMYFAVTGGTTDSGVFGINRHPVTGTFSDTGKAWSGLLFTAAHNNGRIIAYTSAVDNNLGQQGWSLEADGSFVVGSPTGGAKGVGSINAVTVWRNGTSLDSVFEPDYKALSIDQMSAFFRSHHHLPTIPTREVNVNGSTNLGALEDRLWETVEVQARYIAELNVRLTKLEILNRNLRKRRR